MFQLIVRVPLSRQANAAPEHLRRPRGLRGFAPGGGVLSTTTWGWLVLLFPLLGTIITGVGFKHLPGRSAGWIGTAAIFLAFVAAVGCLISLQGHPPIHRQLVSSLWDYASTVGVDAQLSILVDPLSVFMILTVTGVSTLIHLYSISYMERDEGFVRYFSYLNFFVFSMLLLVLAGNFVILIAGWAFVGAASYLLISFWYRRTTATRAGIKAFVINVVGDVGLVLGTYFIFKHTHTLDFLRTFHAARAGAFGPGTNEPDLVAGCILLLVGAFAKSAQIPLHTWLPDAMEGPTPVSSLIHAATMVTAGVYLIARMHPLFELAPTAQDVGAIIGAATLFIAGIDRPRPDGHQEGHRLLDDVADRLHDHGRLGGRLRGWALPPDDPRLLQGAPVHGSRLDHRRDGRGAVAQQDGRLPQSPALHLRLLHHRRPGPVGHPALLGLLLQGRDPAGHGRAGRLALGALRRRLHRRLHDGRLHVPDDLPRLPTASPSPRPGSSKRATSTTPSTRPIPPRAKSRTWTSASPGRPTRSPSRPCR